MFSAAACFEVLVRSVFWGLYAAEAQYYAAGAGSLFGQANELPLVTVGLHSEYLKAQAAFARTLSQKKPPAHKHAGGKRVGRTTANLTLGTAAH